MNAIPSAEPRLPMLEKATLNAAMGWLSLMDNEQAASAMVDSLASESQGHPAVIAARDAIRESLRKRWEHCLHLAIQNLAANPRDEKALRYFAYCQRQAKEQLCLIKTTKQLIQ